MIRVMTCRGWGIDDTRVAMDQGFAKPLVWVDGEHRTEARHLPLDQ